MLPVPHDLYTAVQTRELERQAIEEHNIPAGELMTRAGGAALSVLKQQWPQADRLLVICGAGNNGGDGYELARQAIACNYQVHVIQVGDETRSSDIALAARDALLATETEIHPFQDELPPADVIVDALFGIGLDREITGEYKTVIEAINADTTAPVLSLDIPSGLDADTGRVQGVSVKASKTLSYIGLNIGLFNGNGPDFCGVIGFDSLNVPSTIYQHVTPVARRVSLENDGVLLAPRQRTGHKGLYGHTLIIGGDYGMSGAARIAAEAAARVGSGLTSIATRTTHGPLLNLARPELMCHGVEKADDLDPLLQRAKVITIGPGLGQSDWGKALLQKAIDSHLPLVIDADGLNILSKTPQRSEHWILTPHPGEAARLLNCSSKEVQADRLSAVQELQSIYGGVVILKGSGTLISNGETPKRLSSCGNPGMASGGMGDVLAGVVGGLLAQGFPLMDAACVGVTLHGMAADRAADQDGERGMLAMDLMPHLRHLANLIY